jgi:hypothetical protein
MTSAPPNEPILEPSIFMFIGVHPRSSAAI